MRLGASHGAAMAALVSITAAGAAFASIGVDVNGRPVSFSGTRPMQVNGRVFIPLRDVAETLGAQVSWDPATRSVRGSREGRSFALPLGSNRAYVGDRVVALDAPARMVNGKTMVPLRFAAEALGADVAWRPSTGRVAIDLAGSRVAGEREERVVVPSDTVVKVELDRELTSETARVGDQFTASVSGEDRSRFPQGTRLAGKVTEVQRSGSGKPGVLNMAFDRALLPDGTSVPISGTLSSLDEEQVTRSKDGRLVARKGRKSRFDWKWVGYGAAGGAVLGEVLGNKAFLKGALLGALGGAAYSYLNKGKHKSEFRDVDLAQGTQFGVRLNRQVAFADPDAVRRPGDFDR